MKKGLGASWLPKVGWEGLGKLKMKHETGVGYFVASKSGWEWFGKAKDEA